MRIFGQLLAFLLLAVSLSACGEQAKEKEEASPLYTEHSDGSSGISANYSAMFNEPEGPQYQQPTMDVLKGKKQLFPAKYLLRRYPGSKVAMVDVRPNRPPGYKNLVMLATADQTPKISTFYRQQLLTEQWKKTYEYSNSLYESTKWVKGDIECEVRIMPDLVSNSEDKKYVQLLYGKRYKKMAIPNK